MHTTTPGFAHASIERLCDYELQAPQTADTARPPFPTDLTDTENWGLTWWLWMDDVGKQMLQHCDHWRDRFLHATARKPEDI